MNDFNQSAAVAMDKMTEAGHRSVARRNEPTSLTPSQLAERSIIPYIDGANRKGGEAQALGLQALQEHQRVMIRPLHDNEAAFGLKAGQSLAELDRRRGTVFQPAKWVVLHQGMKGAF